MKKILILFFAISLFGCKSKQPVIQVPVKTVERKVSTLVPFFIQGDSALLSALFECDSLNNVILKGLAEQKSGNMGTDFDFKDGKLDYKAKSQPDTVYLPSDTIYINKETPIYVEVAKIEYRQTKRQKVFYGIGLWGSILLAIYITMRLKFIK